MVGFVLKAGIAHGLAATGLAFGIDNVDSELLQ